MKIVQLVTRNCVGGVQVVAGALHEGFQIADHDAQLWFFAESGEQTRSIPNSRSIFNTRQKRFYYPRLLLRLLKLLLGEKPDVVIAHTTNTAVPGLLLAVLAGISKRVVVQHNPLDTYSKPARLADWICATCGIYWRNVTVAQTVSRTMGAYKSRAAQRVRLIHNGLKDPDLRLPITLKERNDIRKDFGLSQAPDKPLIVTIGRLAEQKNQEVLVEAVRPLDEMLLMIAGDGPLRDQLQRRIAESGAADRIHLIGPLKAEQVRMLLRASDVFVTLSHFEAMPMVVLEAMQEGSVIVASNIAAHRELLGEAGLLVTANPDEIRSVLRSLLADPQRCARLSAAARERSGKFSEETMVGKYLELIEEA